METPPTRAPSDAPHVSRSGLLRLDRPAPAPDVPPPAAATSGPFGAPEILDAIDDAPSPALRLLVLFAALAGALGIAAFVLADGDSPALAATPNPLR